MGPFERLAGLVRGHWGESRGTVLRCRASTESLVPHAGNSCWQDDVYGNVLGSRCARPWKPCRVMASLLWDGTPGLISKCGPTAAAVAQCEPAVSSGGFPRPRAASIGMKPRVEGDPAQGWEERRALLWGEGRSAVLRREHDAAEEGAVRVGDGGEPPAAREDDSRRKALWDRCRGPVPVVRRHPPMKRRASIMGPLPRPGSGFRCPAASAAPDVEGPSPQTGCGAASLGRHDPRARQRPNPPCEAPSA
jgi:hypothetical protein